MKEKQTKVGNYMKINNKNLCKIKQNPCSKNLYIIYNQLEFKT